MTRGLSRKRPPAVSLEAGAPADAPRCPACGEPLFVWLETAAAAPREDQIVDRCENCGLVVARDAAPSPERAIDELLRDSSESDDGITVRGANAVSLQAWLGAENWAALRPGDSSSSRPRAPPSCCWPSADCW